MTEKIVTFRRLHEGSMVETKVKAIKLPGFVSKHKDSVKDKK